MQTQTSLYHTLIALQTLVSREVWRFIRIWTQTLLPPAVTMTLYFVIFGKFIGSQIPNIQGFTYLQYIAPGLIMMAIVTNAYSNTASSFFLTKFNKSIEEMLVSPMPNLILLLGFMLGGTLRGIMVGMIVTLVALLFTHIPMQHPAIVIGMSILASALFSLGGLINGIFAKRFDDIAFVPTFILTPLTYLGGVFYSISQLPPTWQTISKLNPILSVVDTFRFGILGITDTGVALGFSLVTLLFIVLFFWTWWLLNRGTGIKV